MGTEPGLYRLMTWLSPAYPVGAYAFSHGLEHAVEAGELVDKRSAYQWIRDLVRMGNGRADLVFLKDAWEGCGDTEALAGIARYAIAFQATSELRTETLAQGRAFANVTRDAWPTSRFELVFDAIGEDLAYPVVVGAVARCHGIDQREAMIAYGHAFSANLVSAAVRLVPLGQTDGQRMTAELEADVESAVRDATALRYDTVSNATFMSDIQSMKHEIQYTRLFRS
jgi:urease accessory protein